MPAADIPGQRVQVHEPETHNLSVIGSYNGGMGRAKGASTAAIGTGALLRRLRPQTDWNVVVRFVAETNTPAVGWTTKIEQRTFILKGPFGPLDESAHERLLVGAQTKLDELPAAVVDLAATLFDAHPEAVQAARSAMSASRHYHSPEIISAEPVRENVMFLGSGGLFRPPWPIEEIQKSSAPSS